MEGIRRWRISFERILQIMEERGITAADLSKATGITEGTISCWKGKRWNPSFQNAQTIADYFQVAMEEFLIPAEPKNSASGNSGAHMEGRKS